MKSRIPWAIVITLICPLLPIGEGRAAIFSVDTTADFVDVVPGDGICAGKSGSCSLRAAIQESNAIQGADDIMLPPGVYSLTLRGRGEDSAARGDLDVVSNVTIRGGGAATTVIDGSGLDRIFHVRSGASVVLCDMTIQNGNPGSASGGAILNLANLSIIGSVIANSTAQSGGGILNAGSASRLEIRHSTLTGNSATITGGAVANTGELTITLSRLSDNTAFFSGGGVASAGVLKVSHSTIENNSVDLTPNGGSSGGGISTVTGGQISDSTVANNRAQIGGGISAVSGVLSLINSTISGNSAEIVVPPGDPGGFLSVLPTGGGLFTGPSAVAEVGSCTFFGNTTLSNGPSIATLGTTRLSSTILTTGCTALGPGSLQSLGHNFGRADCNLALATDIILASIDPHLGPLAENGGPTKTHALFPASLAVNAGGNCQPRDQRGVARGNCDIGAYERGQFADLSVTKNVHCQSALEGSVIQFVIDTFNFGPDRAGSVRVIDRLPQGLRFVSARASQGRCDASEGRGETEITCELGSIPSDAGAEITVEAAADVPGDFTNLVFVGSPDAELDLFNNEARANLTVLARQAGRASITTERGAAQVGLDDDQRCQFPPR